MDNKEIVIDGKIISINKKPFIIAEMSGNHKQSIEKAFEIIDLAAKSGADAIKLQTYTPETMTINFSGGLFKISDERSLWKGRNLFDLYKEAHTPWEWHEKLFVHARKKGLSIFSSPFDETAVDFLESLNVNAYKIASFENNYLQLLKKVAKTKKTVILSTGLSTLTGIAEAVDVLRTNGCENIILLKCTSSYPAEPDDSNLMTIPNLIQTFNCHVGLSDHTMGIGVAIASVALGARVIEKHFTTNRAEGGVDSAFSIEPEELKSLVIESERAFRSLGSIKYGILDSEKKSLQFKRSVYVVEDIKKDEIFTIKNIRIIRPGDGIPPKFFDLILGKKSKMDIKTGTPFSFEFI